MLATVLSLIFAGIVVVGLGWNFITLYQESVDKGIVTRKYVGEDPEDDE